MATTEKICVLREMPRSEVSEASAILSVFVIAAKQLKPTIGPWCGNSALVPTYNNRAALQVRTCSKELRDQLLDLA